MNAVVSRTLDALAARRVLTLAVTFLLCGLLVETVRSVFSLDYGDVHWAISFGVGCLCFTPLGPVWRTMDARRRLTR